MKLHTNLVLKRTTSGEYSSTRVNIENIKVVEELIPKDEDMALWAVDSYNKLMMNKSIDLIQIKVKKDLFIEIVTQLYKKLGKGVSLFEKNALLFRIPMKKGAAFFEDINKIVLFSEELKSAVIVIYC